MLEIGDQAPDFALQSTSGRTVALRELRGRRVVLYFYPKDDTPGCTREACDFRDNLARVRGAGAEVYGVSKDSLASHDRFREKYELPFELLSDPDNAVARAYGAHGKKVLYGKPIVGTIRSTFVIDADGRIAARWSPVKVEGHADAVLAALRGDAAIAKPARKKVASKKAPAARPRTAARAKTGARKKSAARKKRGR